MKLILLDRDGVLNEERKDFVKNLDELVILPGVPEAVAKLTQAGHIIAVCTNQSGVGKGLMTEETLHIIHAHLAKIVMKEGGRIAHFFACTETPENATRYRKPGPGMLEEAMRMFDAGPEATVMIGDSLRDLQAAAAAGCRRILVRTGNGLATIEAGLPRAVLPVAVYDDLRASAHALLGVS